MTCTRLPREGVENEFNRTNSSFFLFFSFFLLAFLNSRSLCNVARVTYRTLYVPSAVCIISHYPYFMKFGRFFGAFMNFIPSRAKFGSFVSSYSFFIVLEGGCLMLVVVVGQVV